MSEGNKCHIDSILSSKIEEIISLGMSKDEQVKEKKAIEMQAMMENAPIY